MAVGIGGWCGQPTRRDLRWGVASTATCELWELLDLQHVDRDALEADIQAAGPTGDDPRIKSEGGLCSPPILVPTSFSIGSDGKTLHFGTGLPV